MVIMKTRSIFVMLCLLFIVSGIAIAKDNELQQRMVDLERVYIPALFRTSKEVPTAISEMQVYAESWTIFNEDYRTYRSSYRNWISYFDHVQRLVEEAETLVNDGEQLAAHEVLELIRTTMREFRGRNGFPKFITDELTAFHSIMGEIIAISMEDFDDNTISILDELYKEASHAWFKVEKNTVDQYAWGLSDQEMIAYSNFIIDERNALDEFEYALSSGEVADIKSTALKLKPPQAKAYLLLGDL